MQTGPSVSSHGRVTRRKRVISPALAPWSPGPLAPAYPACPPPAK